jgi:O-antigen/teichoic acid export membrane protein
LVLLIAGAVLATNSVLEEGLKGLGLPKAVMWAEAAGLVVTIVSLLLMLKPMGIMGAALASLFGYSTVGIALIAGLRARTGYSVGSL